MGLYNDLRRYFAAGYSGVWLQTWEPEDAVEDLRRIAVTDKMNLFQFTVRDGLQEYVDGGFRTVSVQVAQGGNTRMVEVRGLPEALRYLQEVAYAAFQEASQRHTIAAFWHTHMWPEGVIDDVRVAMNVGERFGLHLVFLSHQVRPLELLRPRMALIEHELPTAKQLEEIARAVASQPTDIRSPEEFDATIRAARGMTRIEARNAFALSLVIAGHLSPDVVWDQKAQALKAGNQAVRLSTAEEPTGFADVGGLAPLKEFHRKLLMSGRRPTKAIPRGTLLLGVPGAGKDWYAEALGKELRWPVLHLHLGRTRSRYQGDTEQNTVEVFRKADRMAPCILSISEIEKMFTGLESSGRTDGGTKANQIAEFLDWMQRRKEPVYLLASCNDITPILETMPEFLRPGRFDRLFYLDVPSEEAQEQIWAIHARAYGLLRPFGIEPRHLMPAGAPEPAPAEVRAALQKLDRPPLSVRQSWTGAEIEGCCAAADLSGEPPSSPECLPTVIANIAAERIAKTREWAINKVYSADYAGIYQGPRNTAQQVDDALAGKFRRTVRRKEENN